MVSQSFIGSSSQTNVEFKYKPNAYMNEQVVFNFKLRGKETGIVSDELTLTANAFIKAV